MTAPIDLDSLRLVLAVDEHGSLGAAARVLGVSQPAASARLRTLESRYGLTLVTRSPRGSRLTEDGEAVASWARSIMAEVGTFESGIAALSAQRHGGLRIAASLTIAEYLLPRWLGELRRALPAVRAGMQVVNSADVVAMVRAGSVGLGFIESPVRLPDMSTRRVGTDRLAVVVSADHPWARRREPVEPDEIAATPLVLREPGSGTRQTFEEALGSEPSIALEAGSTSALIGSAVNGVGPAIVSEMTVRPQVEAGALVEVPVALDLRRPLRAIWRASERLRSPATDLVSVAAKFRLT